MIRVPEIRLIDENGDNHGVVTPAHAMSLAEEVGLDVVEISPNASPPVCKIMDLGKFKYETQKKAAEANLISRREETAAMRSQANTAKVLADNPTLMRLRELEVLEKIATTGNLNVVLGEKGLADRVVNLL